VSTPDTAAVALDKPLLEPLAGRRHLLRDTVRDPQGLIATVMLVLIVGAAILAPLIARQGPTASSLDDVFAPISAEHLLGGDSAGRDLFARLLYGARLSLGSALLAVIVAMAIGVPSGLIGGYYGRAFDAVASWVSNLLIALPGIVVLLALRPVTGSSVWASMAVFGVLLSPSFYRLVRSAVANVRNDLYVDAARVAGLSDARIVGRHILGVVRGPIVIQAAMITAIALFIQAGLDFLGFGEVGKASWGSMLNEGYANIFRGPQILLWPGVALVITCTALALLANALRDALDGTGAVRAGRARAASPPAGDAAADAGTGLAGHAPRPDPLLEIEGLRVGYPAADGSTLEVVHGVTLSVSKGEVVGIVGESGSGKTQTALSVLGLLPDQGRVLGGVIRFDAQTLDVAGSRRLLGRSIAYIPQEPLSNLDPAYTIGSQLTEPLRVVGKLSKEAARTRALELLASVDIADPERVFRSYPHQISGGMAQRVLIAGAVSCNPALLIADEPTTALDVTVQAEILDVLRRLRQERNMAILLVTHNFGVVADLCSHIYVMRDGYIVESNTTRSLYEAPADSYTQNLLSHVLEGGPSRRELDEAATSGGAR
jgi:peptide/nickel transport system permease protein